ncbi:unnamed protein product [Candida verbasci]|uniref:G protein gamma domain-containing protein n=1 Tax=Candida verbasci TaxID=1227364 RepID=A0A9W4U1M9_9ASCO|nr:unnamed protein product [Candida verbasci]
MADIESQIYIIKLKRMEALNTRLNDMLKRERIPASIASNLIVNFISETPDYLIPFNWTLPPDQNKFAKYKKLKNSKSRNKKDCCTIV